MIRKLINKLFNSNVEEDVNIENKSESKSNFQNPFNFYLPSNLKVRVHYEDLYNETLDYLLKLDSAVELELLYNDQVLNTAFKLCNSPNSISKHEVENPYIFGIGSLEVLKEFRNKGVATILICETLLTLLNYSKDRHFIIYLANTSLYKLKELKLKNCL